MRIWLSIVTLAAASFVHAQDEAPAPPPPPPVLDPAAVETFLDGYFAAYLRDAHIAGATVAVIENDRVIFTKGYGFADRAERVPVDPDETLFRIGSVSKLFVWTAVMQLVEQGRFDLVTDVNTYLKDLKLPEGFGAPVTMADLMTHSAGLDERVLHLFARDASALRPLGEILADELPRRVRPPGDLVSYSNHGTALAMYAVEQATESPWEAYLRTNILDPLELESTTFAQPPPEPLASRMSKGYRYENGEYVERPFEYIPLASIGAASSTATDLARFMAAHLGNGAAHGARILEDSTSERMQQTLFRPHPHVNGMAHGLIEMDMNGVRILGHGGDTELFHTLFAFFPEHGIGIAASFNTVGANYVRLLEAFVDWRFPIDEEALPAPVATSALGRFAGEYRATRFAHDDFTKIAALLSAPKVEVEDDALVLVSPGAERSRFLPVAPLVFREEGDDTTLAFRETPEGEITHLFLSTVPVIGFERIPPSERPSLVGAVVGVGLAFMAAALVFWPGAAWARWHYGVSLPGEDRVPVHARWPAWLGALALIGFALALASLLGDPFSIVVGLPPAANSLFRLPLVAALLFGLAFVGALHAWRRGRGSFLGRVAFTLLVLSAFAVLWQLYVWNLL